MKALSEKRFPAGIISELENSFFWWDPVVARSDPRIVAQAMNLASFSEVRRLEIVLGVDRLMDVMMHAEPGWIDQRSWEFWRGRLGFATGRAIPEEPPQRSFNAQSFVVFARMPAGPVKVSFFGNINIGRINEPFETKDSVLLVASPEDLLTTKLKAILDRAEAKDYLDIAALLADGVLLETGLGAFAKIYGKDPSLPLKAMGFFKDGDLPNLPQKDQSMLRAARDRVKEIPGVSVKLGTLAI